MCVSNFSTLIWKWEGAGLFSMPLTDNKVKWWCCVWQTQNRAAYYPTNQLAQLARPSPRWTAQGARPHRKSLLYLFVVIAVNSVAFTFTLSNTFSWHCSISLLFVVLSPLSISACNSIFFSEPQHSKTCLVLSAQQHPDHRSVPWDQLLPRFHESCQRSVLVSVIYAKFNC